jgi:hypothetical protein
MVMHEQSGAAMLFILLVFLRSPNWLGPRASLSSFACSDAHLSAVPISDFLGGQVFPIAH